MEKEKQEYLKNLFIQQKTQEKDCTEKQTRGKRYTLPLEGRDIEAAVYMASSDSPVMFCYYGGGFILGTYVLDDGLWTMIRDRLAVTVVSIGYRRAPEHPYPAALDDAYDAAVYIKQHREDFGISSDTFYVCGNSAGANLAIAVCMKDLERGNILSISRMILNYPYIDLATEPGMKGHRKSDLVKYTMYAQCYLQGQDSYDPFVSPLFASGEVLSKLPPAVITLAERDPLHAEGSRFVCRLRSENVHVDSRVLPDMFHGYIEYCFKAENPLMDPLMKEQLRNGEIRKQTEITIDYIGKCLKETD